MVDQKFEKNDLVMFWSTQMTQWGKPYKDSRGIGIVIQRGMYHSKEPRRIRYKIITTEGKVVRVKGENICLLANSKKD